VQLDRFTNLVHVGLQKSRHAPRGRSVALKCLAGVVGRPNFPEGDAGIGKRPSGSLLFRFWRSTVVGNAVGRDVRAAQVGPIDIGAKVFASHSAVCRLFDLRAMFGRDVVTSQPVVYHLGRAIDALGERALRSRFVNCSLKCCHAKHIKHVFSECQHLGFMSLNKSCKLP
jgi:hypothetical protein